MATYHTVDGQSYSVTADGAEVTVSNASGLNQTVKAGTQYSFVGDGGAVTVTGPHHFVQLKAPFGSGGGNGGGGGDVYKARDNDFTGTNTFAGGTVFTGPVALDTDLEIGNASYGEHAEWLLYLGDPRHQGELHEETTGIVCSKGPDVHHTVDDILEALNVQSQFKDIVTATKVSDYVVKLTANEAGEGPNSYRFYGEDGSDPEHPVDNPCFGLGGVGIIQTVIGSSATVSATTYTAERNGDAMLALPDVDQEVRMYSPWPVSSGAVARKVDALETDIRTKQDKLTFDDVPTESSDNTVKSKGTYAYVRGLDPSKDADARYIREHMPQFGFIKGFPYALQEAELDAGGNPVPGTGTAEMLHNSIYSIWDSDYPDRIVLNPELKPELYGSCEIHIFNHSRPEGEALQVVWPPSWKWYDMYSGDFMENDGDNVYSPVFKPDTEVCIRLQCTVGKHTRFDPISQFSVTQQVLACVAFERSWNA